MIIKKKITASSLKQYLWEEKNFLGFFPSFSLPTIVPSSLPATMIINIDNEHWVGLILTIKYCFYFDSLEKRVRDKKILAFIEKNYDTYFFNRKIIQHDSSKACGLYCCAFVKSVNNKKTFVKFLNRFSSHTLKNDKIVMNMLHK